MTATSDTAAYLERHRAEITAASDRIRPHARRTPLLPTELDDRLFVKPECFQVTGSFKARGAFNAIISLQRRDPDVQGVIAVSSGNHAQALALAARTAGIRALVLIPEDASPAKVAATLSYGAQVRQRGITFANREARLREVMAETGYTLIHPFDDWDIIHGAGTAAFEATEDMPDLGRIVVPTGGGGLASGTALAAKANDRATLVIGVEPERADDAARTLHTRQLQRLAESPETIADGVRTVGIGQRNFEVMVEHRLVDDIVTVSEDEIAEAVRVAWLRLKIAVEPTGALPLAAYLAGKLPPPPDPDRPTVLLFSGGNADPAIVARLLQAR